MKKSLVLSQKEAMSHTWKVNGETVDVNHGAKISWENDRVFKLFFQGKTYFGEVESCDTELNTMRVKINHRFFNIKRELPIHLLLEKLGLDKIAPKKLDVLNAPMPGKVLAIQVKVGDEVQPGDSLITLEAMKMENVIKAEGEGRVASIQTTENEIVEKGAVLIRFE